MYWLRDVRGAGFNNISARSTPLIKMPVFIPTIGHGDKKLLCGNSLPFIAVSLQDILFPTKLSLRNVQGRLSVDRGTKIILLCYARDRVLERIWLDRRAVFEKIAALRFDLVTALNYSVWLDHPHAERFINLKRSLITFEELQSVGVPTVPHIYWSGLKDLERWRDWLSANKCIQTVAINLQTERQRHIWTQTLNDLRFFVSILDRPLHFLITGPSQPYRIEQLQLVLPDFSLTSAVCARKAACGFLIEEKDGHCIYKFAGNMPKNQILRENIKFYETIMKRKPTEVDPTIASSSTELSGLQEPAGVGS